MTLKPFRRVVTGHDEAGRAIIQSDAPPTRVQVVGRSGPTFYEVWNTRLASFLERRKPVWQGEP